MSRREALIGQAAERLIRAIDSRASISPLTDDFSFTVDQAYDIQDAVLARMAGAGRTIAAAKLGLTSRAKQRQMGVSEALYGWLTDLHRIDLGGPLDSSRLIQPRAEPEIAFITSRDLEGPVGLHDVLGATAAVAPALDILDSRFAGYSFTLADVVADNCSAGAFAVGNPVPLDGIDLALVGCLFEKNGEVVGTAAGAAVLGHPAAAVAWFVGKLAERGRGLPAGSLVLPGALTEAFPIAPGDSVVASFDRIGSVELAVA